MQSDCGRLLFQLVVSTGVIGLTAACSTDGQPPFSVQTNVAAPTTLFAENSQIIPFEDARRRKWDSPVIADVDQDGRQDIIATEHGDRVVIFWNNGSTYSEAETIANGDMHGVAVADFDRDGLMDVIIAQGGGDGANPRSPEHLRIDTQRNIVSRNVLDYFERGRGRAIKFFDPDGDGWLDLIATGFPTEDQTEGANHLYRNTRDGGFGFVGNLPQARWLGYRVTNTDFGGDGGSDILFYGGDDMRAVESTGGLEFNGNNGGIFGETANTSDGGNVVEIDFDNDGDFDLFITRAEPQFDLESYYDAENQTYAFLTFRQPFLHDNLLVDGDLVIENLQRTYPHYNVYLGADRTLLPEVEDRHAGRDVTISAEDAAGWSEGETTGGLYIGYLGEGRWRIAGQTQSRLAAVLHNVLDAPPIEAQPDLPARLLENRDGTYVDVSQAMGITIAEQTTGAAIGDFDNDGWADIAVLRYGHMAQINDHILLMNRGGEGFVQAESHGITSSNLGTTGGSIEVIDFDSDGAQDLIWSDERGLWHLMENRFANRGNFAIVRVGNSPSGRALAAGSELTVTACGNTYKRRVGAGSAAFSQSMNSELHVGLGECSTIDGATLRWTTDETMQVSLNVNGISSVGS